MSQPSSKLEQMMKLPVRKSVIQNCIPAVAAMIMELVYNLADTFFIGQTNDPVQVAAISLATPAFLIFMSIGTIFGVGGTSVISRRLGEDNQETARACASFCFWTCLIAGILLALLFYLFLDEILVLLGASAITAAPTAQYLTLVLPSAPFVLIGTCFANVLRAEGETQKAMAGQILGNVVNIVLDPLFILCMHLDIAGAALATVLGNLIGACYYIGYYCLGHPLLTIRLRAFRLHGTALPILSIGIPAALGSILMSTSQIIVDSIMSGYGDSAVGGIGIAMKVTMITGMISMGIGTGVQPLLGYCIGAKERSRFHEILRFSMLFAFVISAAATAFCFFFTPEIVRAFIEEEGTRTYAVRFTYILLTTSILFGIFYVLNNAIQAMGAATAALIINASRQGFIYIPAVFLLNAAIGMDGLLWAQPVADILSTSLTVFLYLRESRRCLAWQDRYTGSQER